MTSFSKPREKERAEVERQIADYLASGGRVEQIPIGMSGELRQEWVLGSKGVPRLRDSDQAKKSQKLYKKQFGHDRPA